MSTIRSIVVVCLLWLGGINTQAQTNLYDFVKPGNFQVGFTDTLIFSDKYDYKAYDYKGPKPCFIQIWHPQTTTKQRAFLKISELFRYRATPELKIVQENLNVEYKRIFINDYLTEDLEKGGEINFGKHSYEELLKMIGDVETRSFREYIADDLRFPVIVYHNGSQGLPFENFAMAEYFASRGFIFVSASFELQFENCSFGMLPYERYHSNEYEETLRTVARFANSLSSSRELFFIGHSFGAQMGFRTFDEDSTIKGMVSLETSIEFKSEDSVIKEMWPEVYKKISDANVSYPFPILLCAATGNERPFAFFKNLRSPNVLYASTKLEFEHEAYLSVFYSRLFLNDNIQQPDKEILLDRLNLYVRHLDLVHEFLDGILKRKLMPMKDVKFIK
jgi:hypothetical protein